jgi:hypothetical protein
MRLALFVFSSRLDCLPVSRKAQMTQQRSVSTPRTAFFNFGVVVCYASTRNPGPIGTPVFPLSITPPYHIAEFLSGSSHIGFRDAAIPCYQSRGQTVRALLGKIFRNLLSDNCLHTTDGGA